jgi:putative endonuclease
MAFYFYVIRSLVDGSYYKGQTNDLADRVMRHNGGRSNYTKAKRPWKVVYSEEYGSRSEAVKRERYFKSPKDWADWQRLKKEIERQTEISERSAAR